MDKLADDPSVLATHVIISLQVDPWPRSSLRKGERQRS